MQKMPRFLLCCLFIAVAFSNTSAQNVAYLNLGNLISDMPETKKADKELEVYQTQLVAKGEEMAKKFQDESEQFIKKVQAGGLAPLQQQQGQAALEKKQQEILDYEKDITKKISAKREELLKSVLDKAGQVIQQVAKEKGLVAVYDESVSNSLLFTDNAFSIESLVRSRLGLSDPNPVSYTGGRAAFAYLNSQDILAFLPEAKQADANMLAFQDQLQKKGEDMVKQFQKDTYTLQEKVERGELSPKQQEEETIRLELYQQEVMKFESDMVSQVQEKRNKIYQPVLDKINNAIAVVAKQHNLQFVFDQGVLLYADENFNLTQFVSKELGINGSGTYRGGSISFGVVNSAALLTILPAVQQADANLQALQEQLQKKLERGINQLQNDYQAIQQRVERGELSPKQQEEEANKLQFRQNQLAMDQQKMEFQIEERRNKELKPILDNVNNALKGIATENGLSFVFEEGVLLYHHPSLNVAEQVKRKLGQ